MSSGGGNAFYYFMLEYEREHKRSGGGAIQGGLKKISEIVSPRWQRMSAAEKKPYEDQATLAKGTKQKLTTHGQTYEEVEQEKREAEEKQMLKLATIRSHVDNLDRNSELAYESFFLLHINYFVRTGNGVYYPAEIGLAEFTIQNGMREPLHSFINPGPLPAGYAFKAKQHGDDTHQIELGKGESDVENIMQMIVNYVGQDVDLPPFYTLEKFIPSIEEMVSRWATTCGKPQNFFRIYPLGELFFELKNASMKPMAEREIIDGRIDEGFVFSTVAEKKLGDDPYSYRPHIACTLHEDLDVVVHCSRSYVTRWGWVMCDHLCSDMGVTRVPGRHCPYNAVPQVCETKPGPTARPASNAGSFPKSPGYPYAGLPSPPNGARPLEDTMSGLHLGKDTGFGAAGRGATAFQPVPVGRGCIPRTAGRGQRAWGAVGGEPLAPNVPIVSGGRGSPAWGAPAVEPAAARMPGQGGASAWGDVGGQPNVPTALGQFDDGDSSTFFPALSRQTRKRRDIPRQPKAAGNVVHCPSQGNWGGAV